MTETLSRQERRKKRTRQRLLDAARRLIARCGYESTGILDITEEADVSKATFYLHFTDKEDLTRTLIMEGFEELRARVDETVIDVHRPGRMVESLREVYRYAAEKRDLFQIMLGSQASAELNFLAFNYWTEVVQGIMDRTGLAAERLPFPPQILAHFIAGACVRLGLWWMADDHGLSSDEIADITARLLREGVFNWLPPEPRSNEIVD
jgi:AcrR family transcriptional regulator